MRVGIIAACPFPASHGTPGGIREHAEALAELGHDVHVITYASHQPGTVRGVTIHRIAPIGPVNNIVVGPTLAKILWDFMLVFKVIAVVFRYRLDLLHGVNYEGAIAGWLARLVTWRPLVYGAVNTMSDELHTYKFIWPPQLAKWLAKVLDLTVPRMANHVTCCTPAIRDALLRLGVPRERISVIKLGIDLSMFAEARSDGVRKRIGLNGEPMIMYTGVLNRFQRIDYLMQAFRLVLEKVPAARLVFVRTLDDEPQRREIEEMAIAEGVNHAVLFPPVITFEQLPAYLAAADTSAVPRPDCPGVPVKLINFMAVGKPVVVTAGASQGLCHEIEAMVSEDHNPEDMADALIRVLTDRELAERVGRQARKVAYAEYDRIATTRELVRQYEALVPQATPAVVAEPVAVGAEAETVRAEVPDVLASPPAVAMAGEHSNGEHLTPGTRRLRRETVATMEDIEPDEVMEEEAVSV